MSEHDDDLGEHGEAEPEEGEDFEIEVVDEDVDEDAVPHVEAHVAADESMPYVGEDDDDDDFDDEIENFNALSGLQFCRSCKCLMRPKRAGNVLRYVCKDQCGFIKEVRRQDWKQHLVEKEIVDDDEQAQTVVSKPLMQSFADDPTMPRRHVPCEADGCDGNVEAFFTDPNANQDSKDAMIMISVCCACKCVPLPFSSFAFVPAFFCLSLLPAHVAERCSGDVLLLRTQLNRRNELGSLSAVSSDESSINLPHLAILYRHNGPSGSQW